GRRPRRLLPAQPELRFQRRGDPARRGLPRRAGGRGAAGQVGKREEDPMRKLLFVALLAFCSVASAVNLRWAAQNDVLTLDPHSQTPAPPHSILQYTYEGLTRYTKDYKIEPCLATAWKQISETHWRFELRKNVKFHDGSPFTADDVVFSFGRIKQPQ